MIVPVFPLRANSAFSKEVMIDFFPPFSTNLQAASISGISHSFFIDKRLIIRILHVI